jgi:hypothetical protein
MKDATSERALDAINQQRNNLAHGRRSLPLAKMKKLVSGHRAGSPSAEDSSLTGRWVGYPTRSKRASGGVIVSLGWASRPRSDPGPPLDALHCLVADMAWAKAGAKIHD